MMTRWGDIWSEFDRTFAWMDELRRQMEGEFEDPFGQGAHRLNAGFPRANLFDAGSELVVQTDVPGLSEKDVQVTLNEGILTVRGERRVEAPKGYSAHRRERSAYTFSRSFSLPCPVNPEQAKATVRDGVLTVSVAKAAEAQPKQIAVKAS